MTQAVLNNHYIPAAKANLEAYLQQIQGLRATTATNHEIADLYATSVFLYATTNFWADAVSGADFLVYRNGIQVEPDDPLQKLLNDNGDMYRRSEVSRMMWGRNLIWKQRNQQMRIYTLRWINPTLYMPDVSTGGLRGFRVYRGRYSPDQVRYIYPQDAIYTHEIDFADDFDGIAPAEVAFLQASAETELATTALSWFRNSLFMGGIFQPADGETKDPNAVDGLIDLLKRRFQGAMNAGRSLVQNARWDYIQLQQDFDKVALSETYESIRQNVSIATNVPVEFVTTGQANYAEIKGKIQLWYQLRLTPVLGRYADAYTRQLAQEYGDEYTVEPDITPLMVSDPAEQADLVEKKIESLVIDLYSAQKELGIKTPDMNLKGLYRVNGIPVPSENMREIWQYQLGTGSAMAQATPMYDVTALMQKPTPLLPETIPARTFIPDEQYKELQDWQRITARKGADYTFEAHCIPEPAVKFVKWGLSLDVEIDDVFASAECFMRQEYDERWLVDSFEAVERASNQSAVKAIDDTRSRFIRTMIPVLNELNNQTLSPTRAQVIMHGELERFGRMAYLDGLISGGIPDAQMTLQDFRSITGLMTKQKQYASRFIQKALTDGISNVAHKAQEWFNGSVYPFFVEGQRNGIDNPNERWDMNPAKENCESCKRLNGQVHRRSSWNEKGLYPNSNKLLCGVGNNCGCTRTVTAEKAQGRFLSGKFMVAGHAH